MIRPISVSINNRYKLQNNISFREAARKPETRLSDTPPLEVGKRLFNIKPSEGDIHVDSGDIETFIENFGESFNKLKPEYLSKLKDYELTNIVSLAVWKKVKGHDKEGNPIYERKYKPYNINPVIDSLNNLTEVDFEKYGSHILLFTFSDRLLNQKWLNNFPAELPGIIKKFNKIAQTKERKYWLKFDNQLLSALSGGIIKGNTQIGRNLYIVKEKPRTARSHIEQE